MFVASHLQIVGIFHPQCGSMMELWTIFWNKQIWLQKVGYLNISIIQQTLPQTTGPLTCGCDFKKVGYLNISIIQQTLPQTTGPLTCGCDFLFACIHNTGDLSLQCTFCFTSTEARWLIRDGDRGGRGRKEWRLDRGYRPKNTVDRRQNNGSVKAVSPRHCAVTSALCNCCFNCCAGQSHKDNVRCTAVEAQLEAKEVQLSQPSSTSLLMISSGLTWRSSSTSLLLIFWSDLEPWVYSLTCKIFVESTPKGVN